MAVCRKRTDHKAATSMANPKKMLVLIVDDDPDFRRIVQVILEQAGYATAQACDGREGLELFGKLEPDVLLVDINMPVMDGVELCRKVRATERGRSIPYLLITVRSQIDVLKEGVDAGATDYVLKPFSPPDLLSRLARAIERCPSA
jgi:CheY-like chemotaxis protein